MTDREFLDAAEDKGIATCLELLIDRYGVSELLCQVSNVCSEKAEHIRSNWQDNLTAKPWVRAAKRIRDAAQFVEV
jgi:hypothetical protein